MQARVLLGLMGALAACAHGVKSEDVESHDLDSTQATPDSEPGSRLPPTMGDASTSDTSTTDSDDEPPSFLPDASIDSGPVNTCPTPIDISKGGSFPIDTCVAKNNLAATCASKGSGPGVLLMGDSPSGGSTYQLLVASDWVIQQSSASCTPLPYSCAAAGWAVSGYSGAKGWYFVLERADGACGATTVTVNRTQ